MRATKLRFWISIQKQTGKQTDYDGHHEDWETIHRCRAAYQVRRMDQVTEANQLLTITSARWTIRKPRRTKIDATMRILWESEDRIYYISGAEDQTGKNRWTVIDATEGDS